MPRRRSPRRRPEKKTSQRARASFGSIWPAFIVLGSLLIAGFATYAILDSSWLRVQTIRVAGAETLDAVAIAELSGLAGRSMIDLEAADARRRLLQVPEIGSVGFRRGWPRGVTIQITERQPVALWSAGGRDLPIAADGTVLSGGAPDGPAPRIVDLTPERALAPGDRVAGAAIELARRVVAEAPRIAGQAVREVQYSAGVGLTAVFHNGLRVTFGDERSYDYKVAVLTTLLDELKARGQAARAVDLRFGQRVTYE